MWKSLTLRKKILFVNLFTQIIAASVIFYTISGLRKTIIEQKNARWDSFNGEMLGIFFKEFQERYYDVQAFSTYVSSWKSSSWSQIEPDLNRLVSIYGVYDYILVLDSSGKIVASNTQGFDGKPAASQDLIGRSLRNEAWFSKLQLKRWSSNEVFDGTLVEPFWDAGNQLVNPSLENRNIYMLFGSLYERSDKGEIFYVVNLANHHRVFDRITQSVKARSDVYALIFSGSSGVPWAIIDSRKGFSFQNSFPAFSGDEEKKLKRYETPFSKYPFVSDFYSSSFQLLTDTRATFQEINWVIYMSYFLALLGIVFSAILFQLLGYHIILNVRSYFRRIREDVRRLMGTSLESRKSSLKLSESSTEQSAAVQETMAAIEEISAMVKSTADKAKDCMMAGEENINSVTHGRGVLDEMLAAIENVQMSNERFGQELGAANQRLGEISKIISDISEKTKIINEIVFQTKLLSFNASVEAARAGDFGKGFAVVAEEVGALAQLSGKAAQDINSLIVQSTSLVAQIISENQSTSQKMLQETRSKLDSVQKISSGVNSAFNHIDGASQKIRELIESISVATDEQSTGVSEIVKAIGELESGIQNVKSESDVGLQLGEAVEGASGSLITSIDNLETFFEGHEAKELSSTGARSVPFSSEIKNPHALETDLPFPPAKKSA